MAAGATDIAFGRSIAALGDVDGDGLSDFAAGAPGDPSSPSSGSVHVYLGAPQGLRKVDIASPDGPTGGFGVVAGARDVDGDGYDDFIVSAPGAAAASDVDGDGFADAVVGSPGGDLVSLFFGSTSRTFTSVDIPLPDAPSALAGAD